VYDVAVVPAPLLAGLERGFRTNAVRTADEDQHALFRAAGVEPERLWAVSEPLPEEACRVDLDAEAPTKMRAGEGAQVSWTLTNRGGAVLHSAEPYPVHIAARWFSADGGGVLAESERALLPRAVPPGAEVSGTLRVEAPPGAGHRLLRISPVQEQVRWFDDADPANGVAVRVRVKR
jgi:hypothetical protein